jgi:tetratricopeptide (TPR) repeat protein
MFKNFNGKLCIGILIFLSANFLSAKADVVARTELKVADSLFTIGKYQEAGALYKKNFGDHQNGNESLLLKLAFLSEKANNYTECLYYLNKLAMIKPSRRLFEKMDKMASDHNLVGYEFDDYNYFIIFYRRYGDYIPIVLLILGTYIVWVMIIKVRKGERILQIHKLSILGYLLVILFAVNVPALYQAGIIVNEHTFLREEPTSGAAVVERIGKGHKLTIVGSVDHWNRVIWNNEIVYIRKSDIRNI